MAGPIKSLPAFLPKESQLGFCSKLKQLVQLIVQTAVRILFIAISILIAAAAFPVSFHAVLLPVVAFSSAVLAAFFFPETKPIAPYFDSSSLMRPIGAQAPMQIAAELPADMPRGIPNTGNNCQLNVVFQILKSVPQIADWLRHPPIRPDMTLNQFQHLLAQYNAPPALITDFVAHVAGQHPPYSIPEMFANQYIPPVLHVIAFGKLRETFNHIMILQRPFFDFLMAYDQAVARNERVIAADSHNLRFALHQISPSIDPDHVQIDAAETLTPILDALPPHLKLRVSETYQFDTTGQPALADLPRGFTEPQAHRHGFITLHLPKDRPVLRLTELLQEYLQSHERIEKRSVDGKNRGYPAVCRRQFLEAPPFLIFQIKRFYCEDAPSSKLSYLFSWLWPKLPSGIVTKREDPVEVPTEITIPLASGEQRRYRLVIIGDHHGATRESGHYTASEDVNGQKYIMSDEQVTPVDQAAWDAYRSQAYLPVYLPVV